MGRRSSNPNLPKYVQMWKGLYRVRMQVPAPLQARVGKRELVKALGTTCLRDAERASHAIIAEFERIIRPPQEPAPHVWDMMAALGQPGGVNLTIARTPTPIVTFGEVITLWANERKPTSRTRRDFETKMDRFAAFIGNNNIASVTGDDIIRYKESLLSSDLTHKTAADILSAIKVILRFAFRNKKIPTNPGADITFSAKRLPQNELRQAFTPAERALILQEAIKADEFIKFANLIAAYGGARVAEIAEADTRDIEIESGIPVFHIRLDHRQPGQGLKNHGSVRRFPLHSAIINAGFLDYVAGLPAAGPLFPMLKIHNGRLSDGASRRLGAWLRRIGITDRRKVFHSHRHTFKTLARGIMAEEIHDAITGHSNGSVGRDYGHYPIAMLAQAIEKIQGF